MVEKKDILTKGPVVALLALICCLLWGSAFPSVKTGYSLFKIEAGNTGQLILFAGLRFTIAGVMALIIGSVLQKKVLVPKRTSWGMVLKLSMTQTVIQYFFFYTGLSNTSGVRGSIITASNVFAAMIISAYLFHMERLGARKIIGCVIGFLGVVVINLGKGGLGGGFSIMGEGFMLGAAVSSGFSSAMARLYGQKEDPVTLSGWQFLIGGIILSLGGLALGGRLTVWTGKGVLLLSYLAFISAAAYSLWGILLKHNPVSRVLVWGFSNPVFGVLLSALILGEQNQAFTVEGLLSLILVSIGITIVNTAKPEA